MKVIADRTVSGTTKQTAGQGKVSFALAGYPTTMRSDLADGVRQALGLPTSVELRPPQPYVPKNHALMYYNFGLRLLEKGVASPEDIDKAMRLGLGHPIGPFEFMDMVGLDIVAKARMGIYEETKDPSHYPPVTLMRKVKAGHLGRKTGKGFYEY